MFAEMRIDMKKDALKMIERFDRRFDNFSSLAEKVEQLQKDIESGIENIAAIQIEEKERVDGANENIEHLIRSSRYSAWDGGQACPKKSYPNATTEKQPNENGKRQYTDFKQYAIDKAKQSRRERESLDKVKTTLEYNAIKCPGNERIIENLIEVKSKIDEYDIRNCKFVREGEKCSSYFLSLEKQRYMGKNMKCVILENGENQY